MAGGARARLADTRSSLAVADPPLVTLLLLLAVPCGRGAAATVGFTMADVLLFTRSSCILTAAARHVPLLSALFFLCRVMVVASRVRRLFRSGALLVGVLAGVSLSLLLLLLGGGRCLPLVQLLAVRHARRGGSGALPTAAATCLAPAAAYVEPARQQAP